VRFEGFGRRIARRSTRYSRMRPCTAEHLIAPSKTRTFAPPASDLSGDIESWYLRLGLRSPATKRTTYGMPLRDAIADVRMPRARDEHLIGFDTGLSAFL